VILHPENLEAHLRPDEGTDDDVTDHDRLVHLAGETRGNERQEHYGAELEKQLRI